MEINDTYVRWGASILADDSVEVWLELTAAAKCCPHPESLKALAVRGRLGYLNKVEIPALASISEAVVHLLINMFFRDQAEHSLPLIGRNSLHKALPRWHTTHTPTEVWGCGRQHDSHAAQSHTSTC